MDAMGDSPGERLFDARPDLIAFRETVLPSPFRAFTRAWFIVAGRIGIEFAQRRCAVSSLYTRGEQMIVARGESVVA